MTTASGTLITAEEFERMEFCPDVEPAILAADAELTTDVLLGFHCKVGDFFAGL